MSAYIFWGFLTMILRHPDIRITRQQEPKSVDAQLARPPAPGHWGCGALGSAGAGRSGQMPGSGNDGAPKPVLWALRAPTSTVTAPGWVSLGPPCPSRPCQSSQNRSRELRAGVPNELPHAGPEGKEPQVRHVRSGPRTARAFCRHHQLSPLGTGHL